MLQLPEHRSPLKTVKSGPMRGVPTKCQATCRVLALGLQYEKLVVQYHQADHEDRDDDVTRLRDKMDRLALRASKLTPTSFEGAAFQIMLASAEVYLVRTGATEAIKDASRERAEGLLHRAMNRIGYKNDDGWQTLRQWLLPSHFNRRGASNSRRSR